MFVLSFRDYLVPYLEKQKLVKKSKALMQKEKILGKALNGFHRSSQLRTFPVRLLMELIRAQIMTIGTISARMKIILI